MTSDEHEDPYRYCVYCNADCHTDESQHAEDCPSVTGLRPVRAEDCGPECPNCGERIFGPPRCMDCEEVIPVGSHYLHREVEPGDPDDPNPITGAPIYHVICVGCAAKEATA